MTGVAICIPVQPSGAGSSPCGPGGTCTEPGGTGGFCAPGDSGGLPTPKYKSQPPNIKEPVQTGLPNPVCVGPTF